MGDIGCFTTRNLTKRELIEAINRAYPDDVIYGPNYIVATCFEPSVPYDYESEQIISEPNQIIQFGKNLKF